MRFAKLQGVALVACLTVSFVAEASAWGPDGHRIVCRIAYQLLDAPRQTEIRRLTSTYRNPDGEGFGFFTDGCLFPDEARSKARDNVPGWDRFDPFETWHFLNVPRTTSVVEDSHCHDNCVLTGIAHHAEALTNASTDEARAEALFFLGHWVGDIHQPLHISYTDDRGGNDISPIIGGYYSSGHLHGSVGFRHHFEGRRQRRLADLRGPAGTRDHPGRESHVDRRPSGLVGAGILQPGHQTESSILRLARSR